jgi:chorismate synthase
MGTLRMTTAGESHGPAEVCLLTGVPAGLEVTTEAIDRRWLPGGYGRGGRMAIEADRARILAGVRHEDAGNAYRIVMTTATTPTGWRVCPRRHYRQGRRPGATDHAPAGSC